MKDKEFEAYFEEFGLKQEFLKIRPTKRFWYEDFDKNIEEEKYDKIEKVLA